MTTDPTVTSEAPEESVLDEAKRLIHGSRQADYGSPRDSFKTIADMWSPILGVDVSAEQVVLCMATLKIARMVTGGGYHRDSVVDLAGYAGVLEMVHHDIRDDV